MSVPALPLPDESAAVVPLPSSIFKYAIRLGSPPESVVKVKSPETARLAAASLDFTR